jgi:hypothetical protein
MGRHCNSMVEELTFFILNMGYASLLYVYVIHLCQPLGQEADVSHSIAIPFGLFG